MELSIIIPCYNEEKRIKATLKRIHEYLLTKEYSYEILVIDNGSTDKTEEVALNCVVELKNIKVLKHKNYGKGWAVKQGMLDAVGEYRLFTDADNSTDISNIDKMLGYAKNGYDVVISSRKIEGATISNLQPLHRRILGNIFSSIVKMIVPLDIKDTQNGFKLFTKKAAEDIFRKQSTYFWAFDVEILALAKKHNYKVKEVPIDWVNNEQSKMSLKGMIRMLFEVINIRLLLSSK